MISREGKNTSDKKRNNSRLDFLSHTGMAMLRVIQKCDCVKCSKADMKGKMNVTQKLCVYKVTFCTAGTL